MALKFAIQTVFEIAVVVLIIYGFCREDKLIELEDKIKARIRERTGHNRNIQRQETETEIVKAAQELLDAEPERLEDRVILLWGKDWHPGVIGIVASRLVEKTGRPVIVVSVDEHGEGKGGCSCTCSTVNPCKKYRKKDQSICKRLTDLSGCSKRNRRRYADDSVSAN